MITDKELSAIRYSQILNRYASILINIYNTTKDPLEKEVIKDWYDECLHTIPKLKFYDC